MRVDEDRGEKGEEGMIWDARTRGESIWEEGMDYGERHERGKRLTRLERPKRQAASTLACD